jgi:hypothetical protein
MMKDYPKAVNILGVEYTITYVDNPAEVDMYKRDSLWGQIDYWTRTIRIYAKDRTPSDIWESLLHEVLHGIGVSLHMKILEDKDNHDQLDILALALTDTLFRNGWVK